MVATITICVNATVIMTMFAIKTITKFLKRISARQFLLLAQNDKKGTKI